MALTSLSPGAQSQKVLRSRMAAQTPPMSASISHDGHHVRKSTAVLPLLENQAVQVDADVDGGIVGPSSVAKRAEAQMGIFQGNLTWDGSLGHLTKPVDEGG